MLGHVSGVWVGGGFEARIRHVAALKHFVKLKHNIPMKLPAGVCWVILANGLCCGLGWFNGYVGEWVMSGYVGITLSTYS